MARANNQDMGRITIRIQTNEKKGKEMGTDKINGFSGSTNIA